MGSLSGKKILFLASGLEGASCRFRVLQYVPYLRELGTQVEVADLAVPLALRYNKRVSLIPTMVVLRHYPLVEAIT